ncbi:MAG TPA: RraA family protein [Firmicutes bacterium]|nr:RraA family protein [Bacillota bacterium]
MTADFHGKPGFGYYEDIPRPPKAILERLARYSTANLADGMNGFGAMDHQIKPVTPQRRLVGPAITVRVRPGDNLMVHRAIALSKPGDVIVVSAGGQCLNAVWGELMTAAAAKAGIAGVVVDGAVRDVSKIAEYHLPIFARGVIPCSCDKDGPGEINVPVACGGVAVNPGDIVVGDDDGVVVIIPDLAGAIMAAADAKLLYEAQRIKEIREGRISSAKIEETLRNKGVS